jgi:protein phosphatase
MSSRLSMAGEVDIGRGRTVNQDALDWDASSGVAVVADGVGGGPAGEVAAHTAVVAAMGALREGHSPAEAADRANAAVLDAAERNPRHLGMATTLVAMRLEEGAVVYAHVGDSRLYLFRDGELGSLTRDHNAAAEAIDAGRLQPAAARLSALRHQLTRALGAPGVAADAGRAPLGPGDTLLLATDGLHGALEDSAIADILARHAEPSAAARALVAAANAAGGPDNVAVVVVRYR